MPVLVVPVEGDIAVEFSIPVDFKVIVISECCNEMLCIVMAHVFDAKVIHCEGELYWSCYVFP